MHLLSKAKIVIVAAVIVVASAFAAPIARGPAAAADEAGRWFVADAPEHGLPPTDPSPDVRRLRFVDFDADAAVRAVVASLSFVHAQPGRRVIVPKRGDLHLTLFDGKSLAMQVTEVALTLDAEARRDARPNIEVLGTYSVADDVMASAAFTFVAAADTWRFHGGLDRGAERRVEIEQVTEAVARLAELQQSGPESAEHDDVAPTPDAAEPDAGEPDAAEPDAAQPEAAEPDTAEPDTAEPDAAEPDGAADAALEPPATQADALSTVDLLVGYASSLGAHTEGVIRQKISETNLALQRSRAAVRLNVVAVAAVAYEQHPRALTEDLYRLRSGIDGLDVLQKQRDAIGADLISLVVPAARGSCGNAWVPDEEGDQSLGLSVTAFACFDNYTLSHELGHNLGGNHDYDNSSRLDVPFAFSYGHRVAGVAATVVAYPACTQSCRRTLQFSNPEVPFTGYPSVPSGTASANNARSISLMGPVIAAYRDRVSVKRLAGADRFETAAAISREAFPDPDAVSTVLVATGMEFPDALSAAPLAAKLGGPLLLAGPHELGSATSAEIARLAPSKVLLIGGTTVLGPAVEAELKRLLPAKAAVQRLAGADRYKTSLAVVEYGWSKTDTAFLATGTGFPDALSAGAAAGMRGAPVLLVQGTMSAVHDDAAAYLSKAGVKDIHIAGGPASVTAAMEADLRSRRLAVTRYAGSDRFSTSALIAQAHHSVGGSIYFASGANFPDALAGAAVAGSSRAPLVLSAQGCVLGDVQKVQLAVRPARVFLLGGAGLIADAVGRGRVCT